MGFKYHALTFYLNIEHTKRDLQRTTLLSL